ncbi:MAG: M67 family metallopeptidase [Promethearchaeota archaeon]
MQLALRISSSNLELLHLHAERNLPFEAVALLFGTTEENVVDAARVELMENTAKSRTSFEVNPEVEYRLLIDAETRNEELIAIFHSHPAPPKPSSSDERNMRLNPVVWIIASKVTGNWESRAYVLKDDKIHEIEIIMI